MPALPANSTARLFITYKTGDAPESQEHTVSWRYSEGVVSPANVQGAFLELLEAIGPEGFRVGWQVLRCDNHAQGANFSVPVTVEPGLLNFVGANDGIGYVDRWEAVEDVFIGRSTTSGRQSKFSLYRAVGDCVPNFRYGLSAAIQLAISSATGFQALVNIDGSQPVWYTYANQNYNSYWEGELRN